MIYLLTAIEPPGYDEYDAKVVCAENEQQAREIANKQVGDEGQIWGDGSLSRCEVVDPSGPPREVLGSFRAG